MWLLFLLLLLYVIFRRTHIAVGHRIQGGSPAPLLFPYAVAYDIYNFGSRLSSKSNRIGYSDVLTNFIDYIHHFLCGHFGSVGLVSNENIRAH